MNLYEKLEMLCVTGLFGIVVFLYAFGMLIDVCELIFHKHNPDPPDWLSHVGWAVAAILGYTICTSLIAPEYDLSAAEKRLLTFQKFCWIFILFHGIIIDKLSAKVGWEEYFMKKVRYFFNFFLWIRYPIRCIYIWVTHRIKPSRISLMTKIAFGVILFGMIMGENVFDKTSNPDLLLVMSGLMFAYGVIYAFFRALSSCRYLLLAWAIFIVVAAIIQWRAPLSNERSYLLFAGVLSLLWVLSGSVADYEAAKMASLVVNTGTTILVIVFNVLVGWLARMPRYAFFTTDAWDQLQYELNLVILPFVLAGYSAACFKELQAYWEKQHPEGLPKNGKYISILEPVYLWRKDPKKQPAEVVEDNKTTESYEKESQET